MVFGDDNGITAGGSRDGRPAQLHRGLIHLVGDGRDLFRHGENVHCDRSRIRRGAFLGSTGSHAVEDRGAWMSSRLLRRDGTYDLGVFVGLILLDEGTGNSVNHAKRIRIRRAVGFCRAPENLNSGRRSEAVAANCFRWHAESQLDAVAGLARGKVRYRGWDRR